MGIYENKPASQIEAETVEKSVDERIIDALKTVYDPEIPVNIYEMGLIYKVDVDQETGKVRVEMTLTSPNCPAAQELPVDVKNAVESVPDVSGAEVEIVWEPPWGPEKLSEVAKLELGMF